MYLRLSNTEENRCKNIYSKDNTSLESCEKAEKLKEKLNVIVIKGGQLSLWASVIAHCGALVLMCLFCCKQLFLHFLVLMITRSCVIFGCHLLLCFFVLNTEKERGRIKPRERTQTNYGFESLQC